MDINLTINPSQNDSILIGKPIVEISDLQYKVGIETLPSLGDILCIGEHVVFPNKYDTCEYEDEEPVDSEDIYLIVTGREQILYRSGETWEITVEAYSTKPKRYIKNLRDNVLKAFED